MSHNRSPSPPRLRDPERRSPPRLPPARPARARPRHRHAVRGPGRRLARPVARLMLYPVVCTTPPPAASVRFDNYNQQWGRPEELGRFLQAYALEMAKLEARKRGHSVVEQPLADGSVKLTISVGGAS